MTEILDIPLHPLAVHAPVILVPLLVLLGFAYVLVPPLRRHLGWAVAVLTLLAPASAFLAIWSGGEFANDTDYFPNGWTDAIREHEAHGRRLLWILVGVIPVWWLFAALDRGRRAALKRAAGDAPAADGEAAKPDDPAATGRRIVMLVLGLIVLGLLAWAGWTVFQSGHSGAEMVWGR
ncbi:hypothetical protein [Glycomyces albidus]|uniref:DUF2231 domain-containing protein n=1 Tax=Glycomyces albidus TaxID=2656774 RepID=A0A6L5GGH7_9ACTN|nr:hypothetical protein [Glycomyces albidus]MQM28790.1 hypothetical protein [Glycomyces albidus]